MAIRAPDGANYLDEEEMALQNPCHFLSLRIQMLKTTNISMQLSSIRRLKVLSKNDI